MADQEKRHIAGWLLMPVLAVMNGVIRDIGYGRSMNPDVAHSISVVPLLVLILGWSAFLARRWPLESRGSAVRVGLIWLLLTLIFEFGLGAMSGLTLSAMLAEYDVTQGRLWPLIPLSTAVAPELFRRVPRGS